MSDADVADVYVNFDALLKAYEHFVRKLPKEAMGFLLGDRYTYRGKEWIEVTDYVPVEAEASETRVTPLEGALVKVGKLLQRKKLLIVGWAHSHPGYGCFLSNIDVETQRRYFPYDYQVALVVDPYSMEYDIFVLRGDTYVRPYFKEVIKRG